MTETKTVFLTGGTGSSGSELVTRLIEDGYRVVTTSRSDITAEKLADRLNIKPELNQLLLFQVDFEDEDASDRMIAFLEQYRICPHSLINNARNPEYLKLGESGRPSRSNWLGEYFLDVVVAYELAMNLAFPNNSQLETIVNISSIYGLVAPKPELYDNFVKESPINYGTAKAALIHLTKELAVRLAELDIRVNTISYGGVEGRADEAFIERYDSFCPAGGMLKREDVYGAVAFLISEASRRMTGQNLVVDGGWTVW